MQLSSLEHVNITVSDNAATAQKLTDIFGWHIRWQGPSSDGGNSIHVGSTAHYLALYTPPNDSNRPTKFAKGQPLNHICIQVQDLVAVEEKVVIAGFTPFNHGDYEPGKRFYFYDHDGIEFEVVSYR